MVGLRCDARPIDGARPFVTRADGRLHGTFGHHAFPEVDGQSALRGQGAKSIWTIQMVMHVIQKRIAFTTKASDDIRSEIIRLDRIMAMGCGAWLSMIRRSAIQQASQCTSTRMEVGGRVSEQDTEEEALLRHICRQRTLDGG